MREAAETATRTILVPADPSWLNKRRRMCRNGTVGRGRFVGDKPRCAVSENPLEGISRPRCPSPWRPPIPQIGIF